MAAQVGTRSYNHNANPTNLNRYSKGNPNPTNPTNPTNPNTRYRIIEPSDYRYITVLIPALCMYANYVRILLMSFSLRRSQSFFRDYTREVK